MTAQSSYYHPFQHLDPTIWKTSKAAHITLTVLGTLMLAPAGLVLLMFWESMNSSWGVTSDAEALLAMSTGMIGSISGGFAWCALCLLYFKRNDLRWQRIAWRTCAVFGFLNLPCISGWIIWMASEHTPDEFLLILIAILIVTIACAVLGTKYARLAARIQHRH